MLNNYPATNKIMISEETLKRLIESELKRLDARIRVTSVDQTYAGTNASFTTDPLPGAVSEPLPVSLPQVVSVNAMVDDF